MKKMENIEDLKKQLFQTAKDMTYCLTNLLQAVDGMGWTDELLAYADEQDQKEEKKNRDVEELKSALFDRTVDAIRKYTESKEKEDAEMIFALLEMADKLGWLSEMEEKAREAGLNVRFS